MTGAAKSRKIFKSRLSSLGKRHKVMEMGPLSLRAAFAVFMFRALPLIPERDSMFELGWDEALVLAYFRLLLFPGRVMGQIFLFSS